MTAVHAGQRPNRYDAIVIGSGHNGLTAACYLQRAGLNTVVLEMNDYIGGATVSRELYPGFTFTNCSYVSSLTRPEVVRDLELTRFGLQIAAYPGSATISPKANEYMFHNGDHDGRLKELHRINPRDAEAYDIYSAMVMRQCRLIRPMLEMTPPDPTSLHPRDLKKMWEMGKLFRELGEDGLYETIRFWTMSIGDYLDEYFENPMIKAEMGGSSIVGTALGPYSPGSAYVMLHHYMGEVDGNIGAWGISRGGMGAISRAMADSLKASGGTIRTEAKVAKVLTENGQVTGVALDTGEEFHAKVVVSNMNVKRTFLDCMDEKDLPEDFVRRVRNYRIRGSSGKLNIAFDSPPTFPALPKDCPAYQGSIWLTDDLMEMEQGYDEWKQGKWSTRPWVDMMFPSNHDPTLAPEGKCMGTLFVQYVPPKLADGPWTPEKRDAFAKTVIDKISEVSPDFKDKILYMEVRTPHELEQEVGLTEGNIFHGELTMDQILFNRPVPGYAQYRGPVRGIYMSGSSNHPGGGVMAAVGRNCAREVLRDLGYSTSHISRGYRDV